MKSKQGSKAKNKGSLQKTSSTVIKIHTHRNSVISQTIPLCYNDSVLSIRVASLHQSNKHNETLKEKRHHNSNSENRMVKKNALSRSPSSIKKLKKSYMRAKVSHLTKDKTLDRKSCIGSYKKKSNHQTTTFTQSIKKNIETDTRIKNSDLNVVLKKSKTLLDSYKLYTQQLEVDRARYKQKYRETLQKLKKYELC